MTDAIDDSRFENPPATRFAVVGGVAALTPDQRARLFDRGRATDASVEDAVRSVIAEVRTRGDAALLDLAKRFDGATLAGVEVSRAECDRALRELDPAVRSALQQAARAIEAFHRAQLPEPLEMETAPGVRLGRRAEPLRRVGVYAPGGRASYPSSVLMGVVPARVAGVDEVVVCSPPGPEGRPPEAVLAACALAGADRIFAIGGAGAVAAMALGTATVPRVDKIVGPGNAYVTEAKRQLTGSVGIDSPAGPSEVLIIADAAADPTLIAAEILAQAEHDPDAAAVLVCTDQELCTAVTAEVERLLADAPRRQTIVASLAARGALLTVPDLDTAVSFAEQYAPEHLLVLTREPRLLLPSIRSAGTIFLGAPSSVAFGDYITGANHVLPTAGLARVYSGLSTLDFVRWTTYQELSAGAAALLAAPTASLARAEGLPAHAFAAELREMDPPATGDPAREPAGAITDSDTEGAFASGSTVPRRAAYRVLSPYDPGREPCEIDLSDNTNLFGSPPSIADDGSRRTQGYTRYPDVYATPLKRALADMLRLSPMNIATGCGSDDVIDSAVRAFAEPGDTLAYPDPTFGMVPVFAHMNAVRPVPVPVRPDQQLDADALIAARATITYLCRPNNPTGTLYEHAAVKRVCREASGVVLIDEAYADFAEDDLAAFAAASARTIVLRTFSKAYGMAGFRVGYAIGPAALIAEVEKSRGPYKVSAPAEAAALRVLTRDGDWVRDRIGEVRTNRARLTHELERRDVAVIESAANFVLFGVRDAAAFNRDMRARGVAIRPFSGLPSLGECARVTVGPWPMMERFLYALDEVRNA